MYIIITVLAFGILIADHELGHLIAAKLCGVKVNEFAIGMGPTIFKKEKGETVYSLRCLPIGGFCAMEGEDEDSGDPRSFVRQNPLKKIFILVAGSAMNFLLGFLVLLVLYWNSAAFVTNVVSETVDDFKYAENGIMAGDEIYSIDGHRVFYSSDFSTYMDRAGESVDMVVIRDGEKVTLRSYPLQKENYIVDGQEVYRYGITFELVNATFPEKIKFSAYQSYNFVRIVFMGLSDLVHGRLGVDDMNGVVGIVATVNQVAEQSQTRRIALENVAFLCAFIAINLSVMNMLPIPAIDGGRIFFIVVNLIIEKITKKRVSPKIEQVVHGAGFLLLMGFMAYIMLNDVVRIVG